MADAFAGSGQREGGREEEASSDEPTLKDFPLDGATRFLASRKWCADPEQVVELATELLQLAERGHPVNELLAQAVVMLPDKYRHKCPPKALSSAAEAGIKAFGRVNTDKLKVVRIQWRLPQSHAEPGAASGGLTTEAARKITDKIFLLLRIKNKYEGAWRHEVAHERHTLEVDAQYFDEELRARHSELSDMFAEGKVAPSAMAKLSRELNFVSRVVETADALAAAEEELRDLRAMIDEFSGQSGSEAAEMVSMAKDDAGPVAERAAELDEALADLLAPRDEADDRDAIVEVRAGAGGDEAALFVGDMAGMYSAFAARKGWTWEVIEESQAPSGGFKEVSATVAGAGAYGALKWERGTHRVQRVPATESAGRVHTSTITVAVMPQADEVDIDIRPSDIRIDTYRASGAGGQHVNTTDSAVRLTHIPTNTVVTCQNERSQHQNKAMAMKVLYSRIFETAREKEAEAQAASRRSQIGTGERSERIRTYNWNQDRVTDHRVGLTKHGITDMLQGRLLDEFAEALAAEHRKQEMAGAAP